MSLLRPVRENANEKLRPGSADGEDKGRSKKTKED